LHAAAARRAGCRAPPEVLDFDTLKQPSQVWQNQFIVKEEVERRVGTTREADGLAKIILPVFGLAGVLDED
jgi:hypothetical protein